MILKVSSTLKNQRIDHRNQEALRILTIQRDDKNFLKYLLNGYYLHKFHMWADQCHSTIQE